MLVPRFIDNKLEEEINTNGYVIIPNFLTKNEVEKLLNLHNEHHQEATIGCWNSIYDLPVGAGKIISDQITSVAKPHFAKLFQDWKFPVALFIVKNPKQGHESLVHRDDTMHDEQEAQYRQCWVPLVDITKDNGTLYVVPKSHQVFTDERPMFAKWPYEHLRPRLEKEFVPIYPKAGDLVVYFEKTLHGSYTNETNESRPVFQGGVLHKEAEPWFTRFVPERNEVESYAVDYDFFFNKEFENPNFSENYPLVRNQRYIPTNVTEKDLDRVYGVPRF